LDVRLMNRNISNYNSTITTQSFESIERDRKQIYSDQEYVRLCRLFSTYALYDPIGVKDFMFYNRYGNTYFPAYKFETTDSGLSYLEEWVAVVMCRPIKDYIPEERYEKMRMEYERQETIKKDMVQQSKKEEFEGDLLVRQVATNIDQVEISSKQCPVHKGDFCAIGVTFHCSEKKMVSIKLCITTGDIGCRVLKSMRAKWILKSYSTHDGIDIFSSRLKGWWQRSLSYVVWPTESWDDSCGFNDGYTRVFIIKKGDFFLIKIWKRHYEFQCTMNYVPDKFFLVGEEVYRFMNRVREIDKKELKEEFSRFKLMLSVISEEHVKVLL